MGPEYLNTLGTGMRINFSSPLGMGKVICKYMRVRNEDGEGKTRPHSAHCHAYLNWNNLKMGDFMGIFS